MSELLTKESLTASSWRYARLSGRTIAPAIILTDEGKIEGYDHPNENSWRIEDGHLVFAHRDGLESCRFTEVSRGANGKLELRGKYTRDPKLNIMLVLQQLSEKPTASEPWVPPASLPNLTRIALKKQIDLLGWEIGDHTYGKPVIYARGPEKLRIGRFTAIGGNVTIILANHRPDFVSTYPFHLHRKCWRSVPEDAFDHKGRGDVSIGNDVWLGHGCFINAGITIGDGAVVGGQAVVTKDVAPYSIVAGNPARVIRSRFSADLVERLLAIRWWDWPDEKVDQYIPMILSDDVRAFLDAAEQSP